jgi:cation:H+ antiporter
MTDAFILLLSLTALAAGAESLVRGASRLAAALGVRPLVIGLIVVGFGTSMPEVVVSALASWQGRPETALGNVLGSNIANPGLILALAALIAPMKCDMGLLRREAPILVLVTLATWGVAWTGVIARFDGVLLLAGLAAFVYFSLRWARQEPAAIEAEFAKFEQEQKLLARGSIGQHVAWILAGLVVMVVSSHFLVGAAVNIARRFGISELVIGATLVAVGTSVPELATSLVAAVRREADISVGNIIGSNIFNLLGVLGLSATIRPIPVTSAVRDGEFLWMLAFTAATLLILRTGHRISRPEAAALLAAYAAFLLLALS